MDRRLAGNSIDRLVDQSMMRRLVISLSIGATVLATWSSTAGAHTDSNLVAAPAGGTATLVLQPTHGCGESPTIEVAIRAPLEGAAAEDVEGWTSSAASDGNGNTVLTWTGGELPADVTGEFPISFTVPETVGELLLFPSVQTCADGQTLHWIDGNPEGDFPAPRLLVLAAGSEAAATIDDVPADAPGREQLVEVVDVDASTGSSSATTQPPSSSTLPSAAGGVTSPTPSEASAVVSTTTLPAMPSSTGAQPPSTMTVVATQATADSDTVDDGEGSSSTLIFAIVAVVAVAVVGGAIVAARRRR